MPKVRFVVTKLEYNAMFDTLKVDVIDICDDIDTAKKLIDYQALSYYKNDRYVEEDSNVCLRLVDTLITENFVEFEYHPIADNI